MELKIVRLTIGAAIALVFAVGIASVVHENMGDWQHATLSQTNGEMVAYTYVFNPPRYEDVMLFYVQPAVPLAMHEPRYGTYIGAYIRSVGVAAGEINRFEQLMGRHSIYKYHLELGGSFPEDFVFETVVRGRVPFFALQTPAESVSDTEFFEMAAALARELGYYISPMFVQPPKPKRGESAADYQVRFARMRTIFREHAPQVAFVYAVDITDADIAIEFYPGDAYVDWVGIRAFASLSPERQFKGDILSAIDEVYFEFQQRKPMFVSLGISSQSNHDFIHRTQLAATELERVYTALLTDYPRVKGIIYLNVDEIRSNVARNILDNYSITNNDVLKSTYRRLMSHANIAQSFEAGNAGQFSHETMRSRCTALRVGGNYYISELALLDELQVPRSQLRGRTHTRNSTRFYPFAAFVQRNEWALQQHAAHILLIPIEQ